MPFSPKILILSLLFLHLPAFAQCHLKMAFKTGDKSPLMFAAPNNAGFFQDLYSEAASRIGCKLTITRLPKQRIHDGLKRGNLDFYPAASFSKKRAEYLHYIDIGITTKEYGISSLSISNIENLSQLKRYPNLIWLMESNSSKRELALTLKIEIQQINYMNIEKMLQFINTRPQYEYFYIADKEILDTYLISHQANNMKKHGLRIHKNCCGKEIPMFLGFSKSSEHYQDTTNEAYRNKDGLSATNQLKKLANHTIAHQLSVSLKKMKQEGFTKKTYNKWYPKKN